MMGWKSPGRTRDLTYGNIQPPIAHVPSAIRETRMEVPGMSPSMKFAGSVGVAGRFTLPGRYGKLLSSDDLHNQLQATIGRLDTLLDKINNGQGTLGQLLVNPSLYQNLDSTTREVNGLMKDFRANPKKFLRIKLGLF